MSKYDTRIGLIICGARCHVTVFNLTKVQIQKPCYRQIYRNNMFWQKSTPFRNTNYYHKNVINVGYRPKREQPVAIWGWVYFFRILHKQIFLLQ